MLCDARLGLTELDELLLELIRPRVEQGLPFLILLTKADKLNRSESSKVQDITRLQAGGGRVMLFSALKKQGLEQVAQWLFDTTRAAATAQADAPAPDAPDQPDSTEPPSPMRSEHNRA